MAKDIVNVNISELREHPKNPNKHSPDQITRLAKIIKYQGFRAPIIVSKRSGYIIAGHGRLQAAKELGLTEVPVTYQDFESDEQEYAAMVADNSIADWSELDFGAINLELPELGPDFDLDLLGIEKFTLDFSEKLILDDSENQEPENKTTEHECPRCKYKW